VREGVGNAHALSHNSFRVAVNEIEGRDIELFSISLPSFHLNEKRYESSLNLFLKAIGWGRSLRLTEE